MCAGSFLQHPNIPVVVSCSILLCKNNSTAGGVGSRTIRFYETHGRGRRAISCNYSVFYYVAVYLARGHILPRRGTMVGVVTVF